jgi:hypothetical protein
VSKDDIAKDVRSLAAAHGDLDEVVRNRKKEMEHNRLSVDRVHWYISDDSRQSALVHQDVATSGRRYASDNRSSLHPQWRWCSP